MSGERVGVSEQETIQPILDKISAKMDILLPQVYAALEAKNYDTASMLWGEYYALYMEHMQRRGGYWTKDRSNLERQ